MKSDGGALKLSEPALCMGDVVKRVSRPSYGRGGLASCVLASIPPPPVFAFARLGLNCAAFTSMRLQKVFRSSSPSIRSCSLNALASRPIWDVNWSSLRRR
jgi:hypothetical protein